MVSRYKLGPLFTPPVVSKWEGPLATLVLPNFNGGVNWPGASVDPETKLLYSYSFTQAWALGVIAERRRSDPTCTTSRAWRAIRTRLRPAPAAVVVAAARRAARSDGSGTAADQTAVRPHHGNRSQQGRHRLAGRARRNARQHQESPGAQRAEHTAHRAAAGPHRDAGDQDAPRRGRARLHHDGQRTARRDASRVQQGDRRGGGCRVYAGAANRIADDLHAWTAGNTSSLADQRRRLQRRTAGLRLPS